MSPEAGMLLVGTIAPIIEAIVPRRVQPVGAEDAGELVQDTIASAAKMVESCEVRGRRIIPNSIAFYAIQRARSGRRSYSAAGADALCPSAQLDRRVTVECMDEQVGECDAGEPLTLHDVLAAPDEDPSQTAAREIDWAELLEDFNARDVALLQCTAEGGRLNRLAAQFGVSPGRLCQIKLELGRQVRLRWGPDALENAMRLPAWSGNVKASREQQACRHERALEAHAARSHR